MKGLDLETMRELCAKYWNPIGFPMRGFEFGSDMDPIPENEYDVYLSHVQELLRSNANDYDILEYLTKVERDYIMISQPSGDKERFISELRQKASG